MEKINESLYEELLRRAAVNSRRRLHHDLRNSAEDGSQRMLNAIWPDSVIPVHRHRETNETVIVLRGVVEEVLFDNSGKETERVRMTVGEGVQVPKDVYHTAVALEPSVIVEFKEGKYDPVLTEDFLKL